MVAPHTVFWAFGSRVTGRARQHSDLDLAYVGEMDPHTVARLRQAFEESLLPYPVDLTALAALPATLRASVERQHIVVQP